MWTPRRSPGGGSPGGFDLPVLVRLARLRQPVVDEVRRTSVATVPDHVGLQVAVATVFAVVAVLAVGYDVDRIGALPVHRSAARKIQRERRSASA